MSLAQLTGQGSFTFRLGGQQFRGAAVALAHYFAWRELQGDPGSEGHAAWYARHLAERHQPGRVPVTIDAAWVLDHVRLQHLPPLNDALLEEIDPGEGLDTEGRLVALGAVKVQAVSYTLGEYQGFLDRYRKLGLDPREQELPMDLRLTELARALRVRLRGARPDPKDLDEDWVVEHVALPAFRALETLFLTGRLPGDPVPPQAASDPKD